jgi:hypothetical protein
MNTCEDTREHLETCEDCRLHVSVEARLRTQPILEPPKGLVARVLRALPRAVPLRREILRLVAAASILVALAGGVIFFHLDQNPAVTEVKPHLAQAWQAVHTAVSDLVPLGRNE